MAMKYQIFNIKDNYLILKNITLRRIYHKSISGIQAKIKITLNLKIEGGVNLRLLPWILLLILDCDQPSQNIHKDNRIKKLTRKKVKRNTKTLIPSSSLRLFCFTCSTADVLPFFYPSFTATTRKHPTR